ncbi:MAG: hypothetical protein R3B47_10035 [Bacteroidia bacterium]
MQNLSVHPSQGIFSGDAALGPENVITAVAPGHQQQSPLTCFARAAT